MVFIKVTTGRRHVEHVLLNVSNIESITKREGENLSITMASGATQATSLELDRLTKLLKRAGLPVVDLTGDGVPQDSDDALFDADVLGRAPLENRATAGAGNEINTVAPSAIPNLTPISAVPESELDPAARERLLQARVNQISAEDRELIRQTEAAGHTIVETPPVPPVAPTPREQGSQAQPSQPRNPTAPVPPQPNNAAPPKVEPKAEPKGEGKK